jgi:hypothetical protein
MNHNSLYRKLNDMQFDFGMVTQSPAVEGLTAITSLQRNKFSFIGCVSQAACRNAWIFLVYI